MSDTIGKYIQERLRKKNIKNEEAAGFMNIAASTLRKYFPSDDLYISKLIDFSKLLDEDIISDYYYSREPLKSIHYREIKKWEEQIAALKATAGRQEEIIEHLKDQINTQKELILALKREMELLKNG